MTNQHRNITHAAAGWWLGDSVRWDTPLNINTEILHMQCLQLGKHVLEMCYFIRHLAEERVHVVEEKTILILRV